MTKMGKLKVLILGGDGMLGHMFLNNLKNEHEVIATVRRKQPGKSPYLKTPQIIFTTLMQLTIFQLKKAFNYLLPTLLSIVLD